MFLCIMTYTSSTVGASEAIPILGNIVRRKEVRLRELGYFDLVVLDDNGKTISTNVQSLDSDLSFELVTIEWKIKDPTTQLLK